MKYILLKDRRRRVLYNVYERRRKILLTIIKNCGLSIERRYKAYISLKERPYDSAICRIRNRCGLTARPRGIYRKFGISRIRFRKLA